ncbi:sodium-dependent glucose transporter 1A-like [Brachionus plicatilis]|uniref:Sodium-dependent glucose transporter 1A-like n=1 Tax=Brachionus plicatilis TaxID=10195 RepID=A0A3M7R2Q2_BRAPC|nr:sodium-dependent glucose transporter 1A-like [Brachionus plicatilis]
MGTDLYSYRYRITKTFLLFLAWVSIGLNQEMIGTTLEDLRVFLQLDYNTIIFVINNRHVGFILTTCFCGLIVDKFYHYLETIMTICCLLIGLCSFLVPITTSFWLTAMYFLVQGCACAFYDLSGNQMILSLWKGVSHSPINAMHAGYGIGALIGVQISKEYIKFKPVQNSSQILPTEHISDQVELTVPYSVAGGMSVLVGLMFMVAQKLEYSNRLKFLKNKNSKMEILDENLFKNKSKLMSVFFGAKVYRGKDLLYMMVQKKLITLLLFCILGFFAVISKFMMTYLTRGPAKFTTHEYTNVQTLFWMLYVVGRFLAALVAFKMNPILFVAVLLSVNLAIAALFLVPYLCLVNGPVHPSAIMVAKSFIGDFNSFVMSIFSLGATSSQWLFQYLTAQLLDAMQPQDYLLGFKNANSAFFLMHIAFIPCFLIGYRGLPEQLRSDTVPISEYRFLVEETHFGDIPTVEPRYNETLFDLDLNQFAYVKCDENVPINGQLTDDEINDLVAKKSNNEIQTVEVEVPETEIEEDHKKIISRQDFLNMIKQQRDFLLADDNQNRDLLKKL